MGISNARNRPFPARIRTLQFILLVLVSILSYGALILPYLVQPVASQIQAGEVSPNDYQAPESVRYPSEVKTEDQRNAAENAYCVACGGPLGSDARPAPPASARKQRCGACGITNPVGAIYCVNCGVSLADAGVPAHAPQYAPLATGAAGTSGGTFDQHIYVATPVATAEPPLIARAGLEKPPIVG